MRRIGAISQLTTVSGIDGFFSHLVATASGTYSDSLTVSGVPVATGVGGVTAHSALTGLTAPADDHTQYIKVDGTRDFTGAQEFLRTTLATPGVAFAGDADTGLASQNVDTLQLVTAGVDQIWIAADQITIRQNTNVSGTLLASRFNIQTGSAAAPASFFNADVDVGFYYPGVTNTLGIAVGGLEGVTVSGQQGGVDISTMGMGVRGNVTASGTFTGNRVSVGDGSVSAPGATFSADQDTGMYRISANRLGFSAGGSQAIDCNGTTVNFPGFIRAADGSATSPTWGFTNDGDVGAFRVGTNVMGLSAGGTVRLTISGADALTSGINVAGHLTATRGDFATGLTVSGIPVLLSTIAGAGDFLANGTVPMTGAFRAATGSAASPSITFDADTSENTGAYLKAEDVIGFACSATEIVAISGTGAGVVGNFNATRGDFATGLTVSGVAVPTSRGSLYAVKTADQTSVGATETNITQLTGLPIPGANGNQGFEVFFQLMLSDNDTGGRRIVTAKLYVGTNGNATDVTPSNIVSMMTESGAGDNEYIGIYGWRITPTAGQRIGVSLTFPGGATCTVFGTATTNGASFMSVKPII